ncbi:uncharacterized protein LOC110253883 [Exaiptasia diaphana]|uniref:Uncharacterized protein n=1 Tax=Exaiptasia diaphana TaxID=2652724 RepID=A0A913Y8G6_EXADI|nr:uncharacterized protein LOC110253883 [Exaiptasia diaphana]KXJ21660.1 hypothetical protein AC249_AIPGENE12772 [Exaiptasia diaphana]
MKLALLCLAVFAVVIPSVFSIKCYNCVLSVCKETSCLGVGDRCIHTSYKNSSKVVKSCATESLCNTTKSACDKVKNYCTTSCCMTDGCNKGDSGVAALQFNYTMLAFMALLSALLSFVKF